MTDNAESRKPSVAADGQVKDYKAAKAALRESLGHFGIHDILAELSEEQKNQAREVLMKGEALKGLYPRCDEQHLITIITEVVHREVGILGSQLTPKMQIRLFEIIGTFVLGVMQNGTWDLLKVFVPHLKNFFMAAEPTERMKQIADWEKEAKSMAPPEMQNFSAENYTALYALRAQTWTELQAQIQAAPELGELLNPTIMKDLAHALENRLFKLPYT